MNQKKQADQDQNPPIKIFNSPNKILATINPINTHISIPIKIHTSRPWELRYNVVSGSHVSEIVPSKFCHDIVFGSHASEIIPSKLRHDIVCLLRSYRRWARSVRVRSMAWGEIGGLRERWNDREVRVRRLYTVERESCEPERVKTRKKQILK